MRLPPRDRKTERLYEEYGVYLEARLRLDTRCRDLTDRWAAAQTRLHAATAEFAAADRREVLASAQRGVADDALDLEVRLLHRTVGVLVHDNSRALLMQKYFPEGSPAVTRVAAPVELGKVETIVKLLETEENPMLHTRREPLCTAAAALRRALAEEGQAASARNDARAREQVAREAWFDDYEAVYHELRARFVRDSREAEAFFRSDQRTSHSEPAGSAGLNRQTPHAPDRPRSDGAA